MGSSLDQGIEYRQCVIVLLAGHQQFALEHAGGEVFGALFEYLGDAGVGRVQIMALKIKLGQRVHDADIVRLEFPGFLQHGQGLVFFAGSLIKPRRDHV